MPDVDAKVAEALRQRVSLVINTASGGFTPASADEARAIFDRAGLTGAQVIAAAPAQIGPVLEDAARKADVLAVLGGDGTDRSAAQRCGGAVSYLLPLPGGTMNMLPKALYGERSWQLALADTLAAPMAHEVSGGAAGDQAFFVAALLGAPTLWADAREAVRAGRLGEAAKRAVTAARRSFSDPLRYRFGEVLAGTAEAVAFVCPMISRALAEEERMLEAAAVDPESAAEALRLGWHALFDDWRADPSVRRAKVRAATVEGHGAVPVILDGEKVRLGRRVELRFVSRAFTALAPAEPPGGASARQQG